MQRIVQLPIIRQTEFSGNSRRDDRRRAGAAARLLGIDARRKLPEFRRDTFLRWAARRTQRHSSGRSPVTLFADTFTNHYEPEIGIAAVELLERAGVSPSIRRPGCCARPLISKGLLADARATLEETRRTLEAAQQTLSADAPLQTDLRETLRELARAAQAMRTLTDYLDRHPEAFIRGKPEATTK